VAAIALTLNIYTFAYLGRETTNIVYTAELVGILIGLKIAIRANI
jgi:acyl-[acyl carrier protein]--UDP-N-acetylglucosamine O-acyltransferase